MGKQTNTPQEWCLLAERDISVAEHLAANMHPVPTGIITFHCQQAAEKYLKGALALLGDEPPYIHDLDTLCALAEKHRPSFGEISALCTVVTQFSVQPRYDFGLDISETDMRTVLHHANAIRNFVRQEFPDLAV